MNNHMGCMNDCGKAELRGKRGLCSGCYNRFWKAIQAGETTWERLQSEGKCRASKTRAQLNRLHSRQVFGKV